MPTKAFLLLLFLLSCSPTPPQSFSFYHWKADAEYKVSYDKALKDAKTEKSIFAISMKQLRRKELIRYIKWIGKRG